LTGGDPTVRLGFSNSGDLAPAETVLVGERG
jgi:hypothetical protein